MFQGFLWGNFMKKSASFFLFLIILLAAGGFAFYLGWSQFKFLKFCPSLLSKLFCQWFKIPTTTSRVYWLNKIKFMLLHNLNISCNTTRKFITRTYTMVKWFYKHTIHTTNNSRK